MDFAPEVLTTNDPFTSVGPASGQRLFRQSFEEVHNYLSSLEAVKKKSAATFSTGVDGVPLYRDPSRESFASGYSSPNTLTSSVSNMSDLSSYSTGNSSPDFNDFLQFTSVHFFSRPLVFVSRTNYLFLNVPYWYKKRLPHILVLSAPFARTYF